MSNVEEKIRNSPLPSAGVAIGAGFLIARLPVLAILGLTLRVAIALVKPTLFVLGGMKAWDLAQNCRTSTKPENPLS